MASWPFTSLVNAVLSAEVGTVTSPDFLPSLVADTLMSVPLISACGMTILYVPSSPTCAVPITVPSDFLAVTVEPASALPVNVVVLVPVLLSVVVSSLLSVGLAIPFSLDFAVSILATAVSTWS